jgi:hypothetical protein
MPSALPVWAVFPVASAFGTYEDPQMMKWADFGQLQTLKMIFAYLSDPATVRDQVRYSASCLQSGQNAGGYAQCVVGHCRAGRQSGGERFTLIAATEEGRSRFLICPLGVLSPRWVRGSESAGSAVEGGQPFRGGGPRADSEMSPRGPRRFIWPAIYGRGFRGLRL